MEKQKWLNAAEIFDAWRIIPRAVLGTTVIFAIVYVATITMWYMDLPTADRTMEATGLATITIPAVMGLAGKVFDWYVKTGRKWTASQNDTE